MPSELAVKLTERLNPYIDIPLIGEEREASLILPAVEYVIGYLPTQVTPFLTDAVDGLSDDERRKYETGLIDNITEAAMDATPMALQPFTLMMIQSIVRPVAKAMFDYAQGLLPEATIIAGGTSDGL